MIRKETLKRLESCRASIQGQLKKLDKRCHRSILTQDRCFYEVARKDETGTIDFPTKAKKYTTTKPSISYAVNPSYFMLRHEKPASENFLVIKPDRSFTPPGTPPRSASGLKRKHVSEDRNLNREIKRFKCPDGPKTPPLSYQLSRLTNTFVPASDHKRLKQAHLELASKNAAVNREQEELQETQRERYVMPEVEPQAGEPEVELSKASSLRKFDSMEEPGSKQIKVTSENCDRSSSSSPYASSLHSPFLSTLSSCHSSMYVSSSGISPSSGTDECLAETQPAPSTQKDHRKQTERNKRKAILRQEIQVYIDAGIGDGENELRSKLFNMNFNIPSSVPRSELYSKFVRKKKSIVEPETLHEKRLDYSEMPPPPPPTHEPTSSYYMLSEKNVMKKFIKVKK